MGLLNFSLGDIGNVFTSLREAVTGEKITDPNRLAEINLQLKELEGLANQGQIAINTVEAGHKSIFVAGWRPWIGWVCGASLAYAFIGQPVLEWVMIMGQFGETTTVVIGNEIKEVFKLYDTPKIDSDRLMELTLALLGMAGLRTYEKTKGVSRER